MQYAKLRWKILEILYQLELQLFMIKLNDDSKKGHSQNLLEFIDYTQKIIKNDKHGLLAHNLI